MEALAQQAPQEPELQVLRDFLVPHWIEWGKARGKEITSRGQGMCRFTVAFLCHALAPGWRFDGGHTDFFNQDKMAWVDSGKPGGYRSSSGKWEPHHWCANDDLGLIVDLTASQFNEPDIIITSIDDVRYASTMSEMEIEEALRDVSHRAEEWHHLWLSQAQKKPQPRI